MPGIKAFRKIQLAREGTMGTPVAATALWRGAGTMEDLQEVVFVEEDVGILPGMDRTYIPKFEAALEMEETPATFEQLPYLFEGGVKAINPVQDGAGSDRIYTYTMPTTAVITPRTYTIEAGDNQQAEEFDFCFVEEFGLTGVGGEALMMSANWRGRQPTPTTFTGVNLQAVDEILFSKGKLYIDAIGGAFGGTQKTNTLLGMEWTYTTGIMPVWAADGSLDFSFIKTMPPVLVCNLTFEHDATSVALKADWRAETTRLIRLEFEGPAVETPGTTYSVKTLILDQVAKIEKVEKLDEQDGNDILNINFRARYNATPALFARGIIVNDLAALA